MLTIMEDPIAIRGLNPQPLPPRLWTDPLSLRGLNPQPLPPRWIFQLR
jgi:hypothetical protein